MAENKDVVIATFRPHIFSIHFWTFWRRWKIMLMQRRIIQRKDWLFGGEEVSISLDRITDVKVKTNFFGTLFRYGYIEVQTAGSSEPEIVFRRLRNPHRLKKMIFDLIDNGHIDDERLKRQIEKDTEPKS